MAKPGIPKGTRDFSPIEVSKRQYIIQIIKNNFEKFGYQPIETPSFENSETLMGKYGEEGDRLIFKILDSGDFYEKNLENDFENLDSSISIYISILRIFREMISEISKIISDKQLAFLDLEEFRKLKLDEKISSIFNYKIDEWTAVYIFKDKQFGYSFKLCLESNRDYLINEMLDFIRISGLDFSTRNNETTIDNKLVVAERSIIKNLSIKFINELKNNNDIKEITSKYIAKNVTEKALRYDLTVPFARYVVQHQNDIEFPFKRYQIQPVWRADRPQKGRFREFYQCDADVVGSTSLFQEIELVQLYDSVFTELGLEGVTIKINNRKILSGIAEVIGASDKLIDFTVALDKLDKIGEDGVKKEMLEKGISAEAIEKVQPLFNFTGTISEKISQLSDLLSSSEEGKKGVEELKFICEKVVELGLKKSILDLDVTLARGLNYYTGAIFEVAPPKSVSMGSIGGGGRYDDLTGIFGLKNMSGVGISFGLDRIYLVIDELNLFPETVTTSSKAIFFNYGIDEAFYSMKIISQLRDDNIKVELYPDKAKMDKQFKYAEKRLIPFAVMVGNNEIETKTFSVKNLLSGEKLTVDFDGLKDLLK